MDFTLFGLTNRDKRVYEVLVTNPESSVRGIAEQTGINRGSVFESIKALSIAGLVTYTQTGERRKYIANDPEILHELINERRRTLKDAHTGIDSYVKQLGLERGEESIFQFASFYDGDEGLATMLRDVLTTCRLQHITSYYAVSSPKVSEYLYNNFPHYTRERIKNGISVRVVRQGPPREAAAELSEWRLVPPTSGDSGSYMLIYGSKLALISIDRYNHLSGVIIANHAVANMQRTLFEQSWNALGAAGSSLEFIET